MEIPPLPNYASELETELAFGVPKLTADEGISAMTRRIDGLTGELELLADLDNPDLIAKVFQQLEEARFRLAGYELMKEQRN